MRILHVSGICPDGGVKTFMFNYQQELFPNIIFDYLFFSDNEDEPFISLAKKMGSRIFQLPKIKISNLKSNYQKIDEIFSFYSKEYSTIHIHSPNIAFLCCPLAEKHGIKNRIIHSHATAFSDSFFKSIRNYFLCINLNKKANCFCACSQAAGDFLFGKNTKGVSIIKNGIDCDKFVFNSNVRNKVREEMNLKDSFVIGHIGRFEFQKNHDFLIHIFSEVLKEKKNSILLLVGTGSRINNIKKQVEKLNIKDKVLFLGEREDVNEIIQAMDVLVLPSYFEGLPIVSVEAQCAGLPCVFSTSISREAQLTDEVKWINLKDSVSTWANEIIKVNTNRKRRNNMEIIRENGYDIKLEKTKLEKLYLNLERSANVENVKKMDKKI